MSRSTCIMAALAACLLLPAQTSTGEIDVTVQDASGAVIPKAAISIAGSDTGNLARSIATNGVGHAIAPARTLEQLFHDKL
jgi:hypothetical protein